MCDTADDRISWLSSGDLESDNYWDRGSIKILKAKIAPDSKNHNMKNAKEPWRHRKGHNLYNSTLDGRS